MIAMNARWRMIREACARVGEDQACGAERPIVRAAAQGQPT
jgi:hypothetical protein